MNAKIKDCLKFSEEAGSWQNTQKKLISVTFSNTKKCDALNLCSIVNGVTLQPLFWVWRGICSDTESAQRLPPYSEHATQQRSQKCSESVQHFLSQPGWHTVKDSSLIIVWHRHKPASPSRLSGSTKAGVWVFHGRHTFGVWSDHVRQRFHLGVHWREPDPYYLNPLITWPAVFIYYKPKKNSNHHFHTGNIKRLLIVVTLRIFPPWHAVQRPLRAHLWQSF